MTTKTETNDLFKNVKKAEKLVEEFADADFSPSEYKMLFECNFHKLSKEEISYLVTYFTGCDTISF